ncbi:hypothetical protein DOTSEDRAFT_71151 [Dothistroma septosporum NZE10]|uniref:Uncharacterized protein n=1 Tax=Dothistroma septosporum (strain NZE10 / CBS 128990) TaxID=675120 RepID=N1PSC4_DOTSN|nr:hypothetical protein DOTSEDRAFT_71151 [Dothistroma septosporum NZE10]
MQMTTVEGNALALSFERQSSQAWRQHHLSITSHFELLTPCCQVGATIGGVSRTVGGGVGALGSGIGETVNVHR